MATMEAEMKVLKNKRKGNTVSLEIEVPVEEMPRATNIAFNKLKKDVKIPGFRKGKLTRNIYEKYYGNGTILQEAISMLVNESYAKVVQSEKLKAIDMPKNVQIEPYKVDAPIKYSCEVEVQPEVKLGKYKGVKVKKESTKVSPEDVDKEVQKIIDNQSEYKPLETPAEKDHIIRAHMKADIEGTPYEMWTRENTGFKIGLSSYGEDFDKEIIGAKKGETKQFKVSFDADNKNEDVAGKEVSFEVEILDIRGKVTPELTDEFVKKATKEYQTVAELKSAIEEKLTEYHRRASEEKLRGQVISAVVENAKLEVPEVLVGREVENSMHYFQSRLMQSGVSMDQYLKSAGKTVETVKEEFKEAAANKVKSTLVLEAIQEAEEITVDDNDLQTEIDNWKSPQIKTIEQLRKHSQVDEFAIRSEIKAKKTVDFLVSQAKISE